MCACFRHTSQPAAASPEERYGVLRRQHCQRRRAATQATQQNAGDGSGEEEGMNDYDWISKVLRTYAYK